MLSYLGHYLLLLIQKVKGSRIGSSATTTWGLVKSLRDHGKAPEQRISTFQNKAFPCKVTKTRTQFWFCPSSKEHQCYFRNQMSHPHQKSKWSQSETAVFTCHSQMTADTEGRQLKLVGIFLYISTVCKQIFCHVFALWDCKAEVFLKVIDSGEISSQFCSPVSVFAFWGKQLRSQTLL